MARQMNDIMGLMSRTGCNIVEENGHRIFGPPPDWRGPPPARGCEVFLSRLPRDLFEDELVPVLETAGKLYQLRLMMEPSGENRGYAFAVYATRHEAADAVVKLDEFEILPGSRIAVRFSVGNRRLSVDNRRLFNGGRPKDKERAEVMTAVLAERVPAGDLAFQEVIPPVALSARGGCAERQGLRRAPTRCPCTTLAKPPVLGMACVNKVLPGCPSRTGYKVVQGSGRRELGPPPDWQGPPPARGCEVFLGRLPRDLYEDELVPVLETAGKLYQLRLMMEPSGENRGYAFAVYATRAEAAEAVKKLDEFEIRPGSRIAVRFSVDNRRLFIGELPKDKERAEVMTAVSGATEGVVDVKMSVCYRDQAFNRGYAIVEYESHHAAAAARRKLLRIPFRPWGQTVQVDWAIPERDTAAAAAAAAT